MCIKRCRHTCTDSGFPFNHREQEREEDAFSVYQKIILPNTVCCKYDLLVALRRVHASSGKICVYYLILITLKLRKKEIIAHFRPTFNAVSGTTILSLSLSL